MNSDNRIFIKYDIETYCNFFCVVFKYEDRFLNFEISERKDEEKELKKFIRKGIKKEWFFVGFNNIRFDAQVLQWLLDQRNALKELSGVEKAKQIYNFAQVVIQRSNAKEFLPYREESFKFKQVDLFLQNHYNNVARATSLKWLEFSMNWEKIQDLPYHHKLELSVDVLDEVINYCENDVNATDKFFGKCNKLVELRFAQHEGSPALMLFNKSDSSVGETLFLEMMSTKLGIDRKELKRKQTHHKEIRLKDVILPTITFETEEFKSVLKYFKGSVITSTNGAFKHTVQYKGIDYVYGTGGIHASPSNSIVEEDETHMLLDLDVSSYYPNLSIRNGFFPKHLSSVFCELYEELYNARKKIPKDNPQNKSLKLLLNSVYGKSGDLYSFLYDKFFQMCITVNGQLLLSMLVEKMSFIEGVSVFYANTDGITLKVNKDPNIKKKVFDVWKWWESLTKLELEHAVYKKMIIRDVNNYLAEMGDGSIKLKGVFEIDVDFHKNRSQRIVPIAVKRYFIDGVPVEDTIKNHLFYGDYDNIENQGIYDFCIGKKIQSNQKYSLEESIEREIPEHSKEERLEFLENNGWVQRGKNEWINNYQDFSEKKGYGFTEAYRRCFDKVHPAFSIIEEITDKVVRFYVSKSGLYLNKNYNDGRKEVTVGGNRVQLFQQYVSKEYYKIDYSYYIEEAYKIIYEVDGTNQRVEEERKEAKEKLQKEKELENFKKFCLDKEPTKRQYELYRKDWLTAIYGDIKTK